MKINKVFTMVLAGGLILSSGFTVLANNTNISLDIKSNNFRKTIQEKQLKGNSNVSMKEKMQYKMKENRHEDFMNKLVEEKIITQEQADQWTIFQEKIQEELKAEMEKIKNMNEEERKSYFAENKKEKVDFISEVVNAKIITQEQADKITSLRRQFGPKDGMHKGRGIGGCFPIETLVEKNLISKEQGEKIVTFFTEKMEKRKEEMEKIKDMTEEERKAYFENKQKTDPISELVAEKIITQEQADAILKEIPAEKENMNKTRGMNKFRINAKIEEGTSLE